MQYILLFVGTFVAALLAFLLSKRIGTNKKPELQRNDLRQRSTATDQTDQMAQLMEVLDILPMGVVVVDSKSGRRFRNDAAVAMTGVRYVDVLVDQAVDEMISLVEKNGSGDRVLEAIAGTTRFLDIHGKKLDSQNIIVTVEDITKKSRIETLQTDFVANLSHELKTPIGAVAALADSLDGETETKVVWRLAERIVSESHRMARIVDDLLDLSRIEFSGTEDWTNFDLAQVLREVVDTNQHAAKRKNLELTLVNDGQLDVRGDRSQLVSCFSNLVDNAIKYSESDGSVVVESLIEGQEIVVSVSDRGIGIAKQDLNRIFERFYRVDKARSRATGGTGLGLSIVRHIALEHGGSIDVDSEEGIGSKFIIRLPHNLKQSAEETINKPGVLI